MHTDHTADDVTPPVEQGLLSLVLERIPYPVAWKGRDLRYLGCNAAFARFAGAASPADVVGRTDHDLRWSPGDADTCRADDATVVATGSAKLHVVASQTTASGERIWIDTSRVPLIDAHGQVMGVLGIFADVTEQKVAQQELQHVRDHLETAIGSMDSGLVLYDKDERLVLCNDEYRRIYGPCAHMMQPGVLYADLLRAFAATELQLTGSAVDDWTNQRLAQHRRCESEWTQVLPDRHIRVNDRRTADGGIVSLRTDITELKRIEQELRQAKDLAETASRAKTDFLANMSHEIRTPMTAILGFTDILIEQADDAETLRSLRTVKRNGENLLGLINDILDLTRVEAGKVSTQLEPVELHQIIDDVAELMALRADSKHIRLDVAYATSIPRCVITDAARVRQVLVNLVGNAVKFTEVGGVSIETSYQRDGDAASLEVTVRDTGIGVSDEQMRRIFSPFEQADPSLTRRYGGSGLGLSISRRLAELLGGTIEAESVAGHGSTFRFRFAAGVVAAAPLWRPPAGVQRRAADAPAEQALLPDLLRGRTVLLAEDGPDNQRLLSHILQKAGAEVLIAENGHVALELLQQRPAAAPVDLVLMDMQMPTMDGYESTRAIRAGGFRMPIVALTAHAMAGDRDRCLTAGCSDYLSKPVHRSQLLATCRRWLEATPGQDDDGRRGR